MRGRADHVSVSSPRHQAFAATHADEWADCRATRLTHHAGPLAEPSKDLRPYDHLSARGKVVREGNELNQQTK